MTDRRHPSEDGTLTASNDGYVTEHAVEGPPDAPLQTVDPALYRIEGEHGRGGIGIVLRAVDRRLERVVALKELQSDGERARLRFLREMRLTARLQHPGIVPIHEAGQWHQGAPFYAMKLVNGRSLKEVLSTLDGLTARLSLLPNILSVVDAIAYAHTEHIIHRDLKPSNILLGDFGETVVIDWGLAKDLRVPDSSNEGSHRDTSVATEAAGLELTQLGNIVGTPVYMPPEQARGLSVDQRADVYSLGAILYHLVAGRPPYLGPSSIEIIRQVTVGPPAPLEQVQPRAPRDLVTIVQKAMARDPGERFSAKQLAEELKRFQTGQLVASHKYTFGTLIRRWASRHRASLLVAATAFAVVVAMAVISIRQIVVERDVANHQRGVAEHKTAEVLDGNAQLLISQARGVLDKDPTRALAWLSHLPEGTSHLEDAQRVAEDAVSREVARAILRLPVAGIRQIAFSDDSSTLISVASKDGIRVWDTRSATLSAYLPISSDDPAFAANDQHTTITYASSDGAVKIWRKNLPMTAAPLPAGELVDHLALSDDSQSLAIAMRDEPIIVLSLRDGFTTRRSCSSAHDTATTGLAFTGDQSRIVATNAKGHIEIINASNGGCRNIELHFPISILQLSPRGDFAVVNETTGGAHLIELSTGAIEALPLSGVRATQSVFSPAGDSIASACEDGAVRVLNLATRHVTTMRGPGERTTTVAFSPDGGLIAAGMNNGVVKVWSTKEPEDWTLTGHGTIVTYVAFSPDGRLIASAAADGSIRFWHAPSSRSKVLLGGGDALYASAFSPDGSTLAADSHDGFVYVWQSGEVAARRFSGHSDIVHGIHFSPDGHKLVTSSRDHTARIWDISSGGSVALRGHTGTVRDAGFSSDGSSVVTGGDDGSLRVWDLAGTLTYTGKPAKGAIHRVLFSPSEKSVFGIGQTGALIECDIGTDNCAAWSAHSGDVFTLAYDSVTKSVITGGWDGLVLGFSTVTQQSRVIIQTDDHLQAIAIATSGAIACGGDQGIIRITRTDGRTSALRGAHSGTITSLAFSPDGALLASASLDGTARVWEVATGRHRILRGHHDAVIGLSFSGDGKTLATASLDGTVRLWTDFQPRDLGHTIPSFKAWIAEQTSEQVSIDSPLREPL